MTEPPAPAPPPAPLPDRPARGILWMLGSVVSFTAVNVIVHHLGAELPAAQTSFVRFLWSLLFLAPAILALLRAGHGRGTWGMFALRGALHAVAVLLWFFAMARIPMQDVTAIGYLNPIVVTLGGALLLGEGFAPRRALAVAAALAGGLVILRPGMREILPGHLAQLGAALFFGGAYLVAKRLTATVGAQAIVAAMTLVVTLCLAPVAIAVWEPLGLVEILWLGLTALFATLGHYLMTRAFQCAPVTVTQPVVFLQLVFATTAGWLLFGEAVDPFVILGGAIIVAAVSALTWRETQLRRRAAAALPGAL